MLNLALGYTDYATVKYMEWDNSNGILIAGKSGSGKSQTASHYLTQYAAMGARLIVCDFDASVNTEQTLINRLEHLQDSFLLPPATTGEQIIQYLEIAKMIGDRRYRGIDTDKYPIIFAIDEVSAFLLSNRPPRMTRTIKLEDDWVVKEEKPTYIEEFLGTVNKLRKVNFRFLLIGQEWAQFSTQGAAAIRSAFSHRIIHSIDARGAKLLLAAPSAATLRMIENLETGKAMYFDTLLTVPFLASKDKNWAAERVSSVFSGIDLQRQEVNQILNGLDMRSFDTSSNFDTEKLDDLGPKNTKISNAEIQEIYEERITIDKRSNDVAALCKYLGIEYTKKALECYKRLFGSTFSSRGIKFSTNEYSRVMEQYT
jgi:hypothetical protein